MNGYKNAPHVTPKVGDVIQCGGADRTVTAVHPVSSTDSLPPVINCAFGDQLTVSVPWMATLVRSVDGYEPEE